MASASKEETKQTLDLSTAPLDKSKYPPAEPGALEFVSRSKRLEELASALPWLPQPDAELLGSAAYPPVLR